MMRTAFACAAAAWAAIFSVLHVVWAMGWPVGLNAEAMREAFRRPWFLAYDVTVAAACALGAAVALASVQPWGRRFPKVTRAFLWVGTVVLLLRGGTGALQRAYHAATGAEVPLMTTFWDLWFALGAVLFALVTFHSGRRQR